MTAGAAVNESAWLNGTTPGGLAAPAGTAGAGNAGLLISTIAYSYILPGICVFGIVGNVANLITLSSRRLKAVSYMYLRALAIADLGCMLSVLVFCVTFFLDNEDVDLTPYWLYGFYKAHVMLTMINWTTSCGVLIVVALTLDRFISVVFPIYFRQYNSPTRAAQAIMISIAVSTLFYVPYATHRHAIDAATGADGRTRYKAVDSAWSEKFGWKFYELVRELVLRALPIVALCVLNIGIIIAFRKRKQFREQMRGKPNALRHTPSTTQSGGQTQQRDDALLYLLFGIVVMFFFCNIPAAINLLVITEALKKKPSYQAFRACANLLEIFNHATNFYIFCLCSGDYRTTLVEKFPWLKAVWRSGRRLVRLVRRRSSCASSSDYSQALQPQQPLPPLDAASTAKHTLRQGQTDDGTAVIVHQHNASPPTGDNDAGRQPTTVMNYRDCLLQTDRDDRVKTVAVINSGSCYNPQLVEDDIDGFEPPLMSTL